MVLPRGVRSSPTRSSVLKRSAISDRVADLQVQIRNYPGVTMHRRVIFSRELGYLIVEDTVRASDTRTYSQLWHLTEDARPVISGRRTWTRRAHGNVLIQQLVPGGASISHMGETEPIQGWISRSYGQRAPAPVVMHTAGGRQVRFLTLIAA